MSALAVKHAARKAARTPRGSLSISECGPTRPSNADWVIVDDRQGIYIVADGVGSLPSSAEASRFSAETAHRILRAALKADPLDDPDLVKIIRDVWPAFVDHFGAIAVPATTLTIVLVRDGHIHYATVGDSPVFLLIDGTAHLMTRDHTVADRGRIISSYSTLKTLGGSTKLFSSVGKFPPQPVSYPSLPCPSGARILLCSDGLLEVVSQDELGALSLQPITLGALRRAIARRGAARTAPDNYSAILVDISREEST